MVKTISLSPLALLIPLLCIIGYVVSHISHSPRFGSEAGREFQASFNATVRLGAGPLQGTEQPHREAMALLSRYCGVAATLSTWLTSSWRPTVSVIMHYVTPRTQSRLASSEVLERRAGAVELDKLAAFLLPHGQVDRTFSKVHVHHFMKYNYSLENGSVPDGTTNNFPNENATNHSDNVNFTNHSDINNTIYQNGDSINHGGEIKQVLKANAFPILLILPLLVGLMLPPRPGGGNPQGHNHVHQETSHRTPPRWGPEMESRYSFRSYITDLQLWSMMTDLAPHQQVAAVILRLSGAAKDLARTLTPNEIINGGISPDGVQLDPLSYLVVGLHARFAPLGEETRLQAMTELLSFGRRSGEGINQVLTRYEIVRQRAHSEGFFVMSTEGCALQLLRACGVSTNQMMQLLQPFNTTLPANEQQLSALFAAMRRMGHITENTPGNIGATLHGSRGGGPSHFLTESVNTSITNHSGAGDEVDIQGNDQQNHLLGHLPSPEQQWTATYMTNHGTGSSSSSWQNSPSLNHWGNLEDTTSTGSGAYWQTQSADVEDDSGTETDTSSDSGHEEIDMSDLNGLDHGEASAHAYWQYRLHKRKWRRLSSKPTRKFRRIHKRFRIAKGKGKGFSRHAMRTKGNGKGQPLFHVEAFNEALTYLSGKGKGNRRHTSGKGTGRRLNPTGRDGLVMKCRVCNSPEHFEARCPQSRNNHASPQLFIQTVEGPLADILSHTNHGVTSYPIFSTSPVPEENRHSEERTLSFMVRDRTPNPPPDDPIWQQETDPWQGTARAIPKPPPQEHSRLAPKAKAAPEQQRSSSVWTNWAATVQTSAESSDTSRVAQASEQAIPTNPQQPPRLRPRLRITSDLGPPLQEIFRDSPSPPRNIPATLPRETRETNPNTNHANASIFGHQMGDTNHGVNPNQVPDSAFMRAARSGSPEARTPTVGNVVVNGIQRTPQIGSSRGDNTIQQFIAGHQMANEMRAQHRQQVRNDRAGGTRTSSQVVPTAFQNMTALSQGRLNEPPVQAPVHNPDPLGLFPNLSLFAGPIMVPQQNSVPNAPTQQVENTANQAPVITTPDPNLSQTRHTPEYEVPVIFDGDNRTCTICQEELIDGERVVRLRCRHVYHSGCWMSAMLNHGALIRANPRERNDDPDCPNCRGQGSIIALWNYIDPNLVTQPGATNLWTGENTWDDLIQSNDSESSLSLSEGHIPSPPDVSDTVLINHGQSNPEQMVEPDPRQAFQTAEQTTNHGRHIPVHHHMGTPNVSRAESTWGTPDSSTRSIRPGRNNTSSYRAVPRSRSTSVNRPRDLPPSSFIVLPSTYLDANEWSMPERRSSTPINHDEIERENVYHSETRLPDGRPSLLVDPGSVANLCGDKWAQECAKMALQYGLKPSQNKRTRPLSVMGVGNGNQTCTHDCTLPIAMSRENDTTVIGNFTTPVVANSELPGLLGLKTMRNNRAVLDMVNLQLHFCGPSDINLTLPPGTKSFQLEISPSGHLVLPCTNFENMHNNPPNPLRDTAVVLPVIDSGINHGTHITNETSVFQNTGLDL